MGFKYDNIIMEEAAQILEIETFIPLLLQTPQVKWPMNSNTNLLNYFEKYRKML